MAFANERLKNC